MADRAQGANSACVVNMLLSECAWGRLEAGPQWVPVGRLATDRSGPLFMGFFRIVEGHQQRLRGQHAAVGVRMGPPGGRAAVGARLPLGRRQVGAPFFRVSIGMWQGISSVCAINRLLSNCAGGRLDTGMQWVLLGTLASQAGLQPKVLWVTSGPVWLCHCCWSAIWAAQTTPVQSMGNREPYALCPVIGLSMICSNQPAARSPVCCSCLGKHLLPFCARGRSEWLYTVQSP